LRLFYYSFLKFINQGSLNILGDSRFIIHKRICCLIFFAVIGGSIINWLIFPFLPFICLTFFSKILTLLTCLLGGLFGFFLSGVSCYFIKNKSLAYYFFSYFSSSIWFLPFISTIGVCFIPLNQGFQVFKNLDQGWIEFFGVQGLYLYFLKFSQVIQIFQLNNIRVYLMLFVFWLVFLFSILLIF
jgi:NADH-ubiquinone oxidoreductase chain 5